jgi:hypothetical protein
LEPHDYAIDVDLLPSVSVNGRKVSTIRPLPYTIDVDLFLSRDAKYPEAQETRLELEDLLEPLRQIRADAHSNCSNLALTHAIERFERFTTAETSPNFEKDKQNTKHSASNTLSQGSLG